MGHVSVDRNGADGAAEWWRGAVLYQVYPRSFQDSDGDGVGDLPGLIDRLDHIADLGVDALWVCPFYPSPQRDFGYDISDHCAVDPAFGRLEDVDRLIAAAHRRGLRVVLDLVGGHTSDRHAWFQASRRNPEAPTGDWYVWADPRPDGTPPNNWLSVFGGPAWTWEPRRRQYYLHHFLSTQPALNLHNPEVQDALLGIAEFWLERGVDGFRLDALDFLTHDLGLRDNPANPPANGAVPAKLFGMQRHDHDMIQPGTAPVLRRLRALLDRYPGRTTLGEVSSQDGAYQRIAGYTEGRDLLHMAYTLRPLRQGFDHPTVSALLADAIATCERGWPCFSFSNHDVERAASRWAPNREPDARMTRLLLALLLTLPGSACLYQGEELGLPEAVLREADIRDPFGLTYWPEFKGRDGSRTPMPWRGDLPHAGFTAPRSTPWLPVADTHYDLSVSEQEMAPDSTLAFTRSLLRLRRDEPALRRGRAAALGLPAPLFGFTREAEGRRITLLFNLSDGAVALPPELSAGTTPLFGPSIAPETLPAWGFTALADAETGVMIMSPVTELATA